MSIQQAKTMLLNSPAGPLPAGATGTRFPLTVGPPDAFKRLISTRFLMPTRQFSGAKTQFSAAGSGNGERTGNRRNRDADRRGAPPGAFRTLRRAWTSGTLAQKMLDKREIRSRVADGTLDPRRLRSAMLLLRDAAKLGEPCHP
jgi:hypothetical protein